LTFALEHATPSIRNHINPLNMPLRHFFHVALLCVSCRLCAEALRNNVENCVRCPAVFGLGNQKAGSTVIGDVLAKALGLEFQNDISEAWCPSTFMHNLTDAALCKMMSGAHGLTKEGHLTLLKDRIHSVCPETRFYYNVRHPVSNIISLMDRLGMRPASLLENPTAISQDWRLSGFGCSWRDVVDMRYAGVAAENVLSALTRRWTLMAEMYFKYSHEVELLKYEDVVSEKYRQEHIQRVAHNLGVKDPHIDQALAVLGAQHQVQGDHHRPFDPAAWKAYLGDDIYNAIVLKAEPYMTLLGYDDISFRRRYGE